MSEDGSGGLCADGNGLAGVTAVTTAAPPGASSYDGTELYAVSPSAGTLIALAADPKTGGLTQRQCLSAAPRDGCTTARALAGASDVVAATRGDRVFVAARDADAIAVFRRTAQGLEQLPGEEGCVAVAVAGCAVARALDEPVALALEEAPHFAPGPTRLYVAARRSDAVTVLNVGPTLIHSGCVQQGPGGGVDGCAPGRALDSPEDVAIAGDHALVAASGSNGVAVVRGATQTGCLTQGGAEGCAAGQGLLGASRVATHRDDAYVAAPGSGAVSTLAVGGGTATQEATRAAPGAALALPPPYPYPIADAPSHAGSHLYAGGNGIAAFARDYFTGALSSALLRPDVRPGGAVSGLAVSADLEALSVYAAVPSAGAVVAFARNVGPRCGSGGWFGPPEPPKVGPEPVRVGLSCYDANGDALTYTLDRPPAFGRVLGFEGDAAIYQGPRVNPERRPDTFRVRVSDGGAVEIAAPQVQLDYVTDDRGKVIVGAPGLRILDRRVRMDRRGRVVLRLRCTTKSGSRCRVRLTARRGRGLARRSARLRSGRTERVRVRLASGTRSAVRRARNGVLVTVRATARDGAGRTSRATRRVRVRAARR